MERRFSPDPIRTPTLSTDELRKNFLVGDLFQNDKASFVYSDLDRAIVGGIVPTGAAISLKPFDELKADFFLQRRELGIMNIGGNGEVHVGSTSYTLGLTDYLYVGMGANEVSFRSTDPHNPAVYYLLSYPAHASHPTTLGRKSDANRVELGSAKEANKRTIFQVIHENGIKSCQLVMGHTELAEGSVWNTMPPHTHTRRMEVYMYFGMAPEARIVHLMGTPEETRHIIVANRQAVISPAWSIHAGAGTGAYSFCWGMGGENQAFSDMDPVPLSTLR